MIGILGGGQLGRMTAIAAARLGYKTVVLSQSPDDPAASVTHHHIAAAFDDKDGLAKLADVADVVTYELEQLPLEPLQRLAESVTILPDCRVLEIAQDRINEKTFLSEAGIQTAPWASVRQREELLPALSDVCRPAVFKVAYGGYDGKGQAVLDESTSDEEALAVWDRLSGGADMTAILEQKLDFECELSVLVARNASRDMATYDPGLNIHKNHILDTTEVPGPFVPEVADTARAMGHDLAKAIDLIGLVCLELFLMPSGELFANEFAPRPHTSGHWTLDAAYTDQFEQVVRAVAGLPLGNTDRFTEARMLNIIGEDALDLSTYITAPNARLHMYGKAEARPGRKMGHVTFLGDLPD